MMMRFMRWGWAAAFALGVIGTASAQGLVSRYVAGEHYKQTDAMVAPAPNGKIRAIEFFLYSCPHCYHLESEVEAWRDQLGDDVVFQRVPVLFGAGGERYARLYYTAQALGVLDQVHGQIFRAIHDQGQRLATESAMREFLVDNAGVDGERFNEIFDSEAVTAKLREAGELMRAYQVRATPSLGVAGRYYISGRTAGGNERMFDVADYLISQQRQANSDS